MTWSVLQNQNLFPSNTASLGMVQVGSWTGEIECYSLYPGGMSPASNVSSLEACIELCNTTNTAPTTWRASTDCLRTRRGPSLASWWKSPRKAAKASCSRGAQVVVVSDWLLGSAPRGDQLFLRCPLFLARYTFLDACFSAPAFPVPAHSCAYPHPRKRRRATREGWPGGCRTGVHNLQWVASRGCRTSQSAAQWLAVEGWKQLGGR